MQYIIFLALQLLQTCGSKLCTLWASHLGLSAGRSPPRRKER